MKNLNCLVNAYKEQLNKEDLPYAYTKLIKYVVGLKTRFSKTFAQEFVFGSIFQGYMDYTYFYISNEYLKNRKLKFGLVLNHREMRFEVWLLGQTKQIQKKYWDLLKTTKWVTSEEIPQYSVFAITIVESPDFNDLDALSLEIEGELELITNEMLASLRMLD